MKQFLDLSKSTFAIYGLGITGLSVIKYFHKYSYRNYIIWDDNKNIKKIWKLNKKKEKEFLNLLNFVDYIVISPGININKSKIRESLIENKHKIITDLDLFYMFNPNIKTIVITGSNGKSTACKIIEHVLKNNNINTKLGGNIGKPILNLNLKSKPLVVVEASSFQLAYSKFVKPDYALVLNITNDHLDWHGNFKNYVESKLKIFSLQDKNDYAFLNDNKLNKKFKLKKFKSRLKFIDIKNYRKIKNKIQNNYLNLKINEENMSFVYALSKILKISDGSFVKSLKTFKGLQHRHEVFYRKKNKIFINDSKATSFQATKFALESNRNILWIVGGLPKIGDKFKLKNLKENIIKTYIIGKHLKKFKNELSGDVKFEVSKTLKKAVNSIFKDMKEIGNKRLTILLSPASASYDQFKNFEERGSQFKALIKNYARINR